MKTLDRLIVVRVLAAGWKLIGLLWSLLFFMSLIDLLRQSDGLGGYEVWQSWWLIPQQLSLIMPIIVALAMVMALRGLGGWVRLQALATLGYRMARLRKYLIFAGTLLVVSVMILTELISPLAIQLQHQDQQQASNHYQHQLTDAVWFQRHQTLIHFRPTQQPNRLEDYYEFTFSQGGLKQLRHADLVLWQAGRWQLQQVKIWPQSPLGALPRAAALDLPVTQLQRYYLPSQGRSVITLIEQLSWMYGQKGLWMMLVQQISQRFGIVLLALGMVGISAQMMVQATDVSVFTKRLRHIVLVAFLLLLATLGAIAMQNIAVTWFIDHWALSLGMAILTFYCLVLLSLIGFAVSLQRFTQGKN